VTVHLSRLKRPLTLPTPKGRGCGIISPRFLLEVETGICRFLQINMPGASRRDDCGGISYGETRGPGLLNAQCHAAYLHLE
jgi:hypothetical protein